MLKIKGTYDEGYEIDIIKEDEWNRYVETELVNDHMKPPEEKQQAKDMLSDFYDNESNETLEKYFSLCSFRPCEDFVAHWSSEYFTAVFSVILEADEDIVVFFDYEGNILGVSFYSYNPGIRVDTMEGNRF